MNTIKIRAWNPSTKTMIYPIKGDLIGVNDRGELEYWFGATKCIVMFFTGLLAKQGKGIYEGDIIKVPQGDFAKVIYDEEYAFFTPEFKAGVRCASFISYHPWLCEVIGNIYENKELLKE